MTDIVDRLNDSLSAGYSELRKEAAAEITRLRAKIERMEKQEPVAWLHESRRDSDVVTSAVKHVWGKAVVGSLAAYSIPLYLAPGAQPAPSALAEAIIADMQAQHDSELITENDSGEALIRLDGAIAAVEDNFAQPAPIERQEPVAWLHESRRDSDVVTNAVKHVWGKAVVGSMAAYSIPLYLAPGAKGE
jgi:predicted P-loop ATPase/GTPase